jgi:hypothetical protein
MRAALVLVVLLVLAPSAHAAGWSAPRVFSAGSNPHWEPAPRAAVAADGSSLVAWRDDDFRLVASFGDKRGRFGAPVTVARRARDHAVASGAVAYEAADGLHVAVRSGRGFRDRRLVTSTGSAINGVAIAADPKGGWVVAERQFPRRGSGVPYRVRTLSLGADGRRIGAVQDLGLGQFGIDARETSALAVLPDGRAVLTFTREAEGGPTPVVVTTRPHGGTFVEPVAVGDDLADPRVSVSGDRAVLTVTAIAGCGDSGCFGQPRASVLGADGLPGPLTGPALENPRRAFAPWAAGETVVFQLKTRVEPFSREAPVQASTGGGPLQTLTAERATEPVALPLPGGRILALWATRKALGAALAGPGGRFSRTSAPPGPPPPPYHSNPTNRDARAAGRYAIVAWARGTTVRVSIRRF